LAGSLLRGLLRLLRLLLLRDLLYRYLGHYLITSRPGPRPILGYRPSDI